MQKPLVLARKEFIDALVVLINDSGLPLFIVNDVLASTRAEVQAHMQEEYEIAKQQYESALSNEEKE